MTVIRNFQKCLAMNTIYDVTKIVAANALGNYHPQDPVDFFIVNVEIIVTITVDKIVSNGLRIFVPYFHQVFFNVVKNLSIPMITMHAFYMSLTN